MLMAGFFPTALLTGRTAVGFGGAAETPPKEAHVPILRMIEARAANVLTAFKKVTSFPSLLQAIQAYPSNAVGTPPSTARM